MESFVTKHAADVIGVLSGFDRVVFRGTLRFLAHHLGMMGYSVGVRVLLKDFAGHAEAVTRQLREASEAHARGPTGRSFTCPRAPSARKTSPARSPGRTASTEGLICILTAVEPCLSYDIMRNRAAKHLQLRPRHRKCLYLYHYQIHPIFGFMHARIQTWFPFAIQICLNGREWLARTMDAAGLDYVQRDNCFTWLEDVRQAQRLMDQQVQAGWPELLNQIAHSLNPQHEAMFQAFPVNYYWSTYQSEWATDVMFRSTASLARLYPRLVQHGLTTLPQPGCDALPRAATIPANDRLPSHLQGRGRQRREARGRKACGSSTGWETTRSRCTTSKAACCGSRRRSTIRPTSSHSARRRASRTPPRVGTACARGSPTCTGVPSLAACNERYLQALASVDDTTSLGELTARLCRPAKRNGRRVRPLNPHAPDDAALIEAIGRGEFTINGFRNRDIRALLFDDDRASKQEQRRHAAAVCKRSAAPTGLVKSTLS